MKVSLLMKWRNFLALNGRCDGVQVSIVRCPWSAVNKGKVSGVRGRIK